MVYRYFTDLSSLGWVLNDRVLIKFSIFGISRLEFTLHNFQHDSFDIQRLIHSGIAVARRQSFILPEGELHVFCRQDGIPLFTICGWKKYLHVPKQMSTMCWKVTNSLNIGTFYQPSADFKGLRILEVNVSCLIKHCQKVTQQMKVVAGLQCHLYSAACHIQM